MTGGEPPRPSFLTPPPEGPPPTTAPGDAEGVTVAAHPEAGEGSGNGPGPVAAGGTGRTVPTPSGRPWRLAAVVASALVVAGTLAALLARPAVTPAREVAPPPATGAASDPQEVARLERRLAALRPGGVQVRVDTVENRLALVRRDAHGEAVLLDAVCSTGTGGVLRDPPTGRVWVFDTPKGAFRVQEKRRDPVWTKPDWAFIEEGKPVPTSLWERRDPESLGDYALYLGDGYLIHGTLYQRLLGRSVTHGCVRLGDADLAEVYRRVPIGSPVYLF